jgi:transposase
LLAAERARKREDLLAASERDLAKVSARIQAKRQPLRGAAEIGLAVGAVLDKHKMAKHFEITIGEASLSFQRKPDSIEREARLDGIYVVRTSVPAEIMDAAETVQAYKDLAHVERAFRCLKTVDLDIRPIRHWTEERVRAHVFLCMLAYHVEWHLRQALAPLLFHDTEIEAARARRPSPVAKTEPSPQVLEKKATKRNHDGLTVMAFGDLMAHLGTLARNTVSASLQKGHSFTLHTKPTQIQEAAFRLLDIDPIRVQ